MIQASLYSPPMPVGACNALMDQSREGRDLWRVMQMSSHDLLCELFENDQVRMHFARIAGENLVSPDEKATGFGMFVFLGFLETFGFGVAVGRLGRADQGADRLHRGPWRAGARQRRRARSHGRQRRATGVVLDDGAVRARDGVIGAIHPHLLGEMVEGIDPVVRENAQRTQITEAACITVHAALNAPLRFKAGEQVRAVMIELLPDEL